MTRPICILLTIIMGLSLVSVQAGVSSTLTWTDTTRDVYIAGEVDRTAQVLTCDTPPCLALVSRRLDRAVVLSLPDKSVTTLPADAFQFAPDRDSATSDASVPREGGGTFTKVDGATYLLEVGGKTILIGRHQGVTGEMPEPQLWEMVPVWRALMEQYQPNPEAVAALRSLTPDATVTVAFGTWCGDSKNYVPKLFKALHATGNEGLKVNLVAIDRDFHQPAAVIAGRRIINVPTVIVERNGVEIGRIVETPAAPTIEEDLVAILAGTPIPHVGKYARGPMIAQGAYAYRDRQGRERGTERWSLFAAANGGRLVRSSITFEGRSTEVFYRIDSHGRPTLLEITQKQGEGLTRQRVSLDGRTLTARLRGNVTGIILQTVDVPEYWTLSSPGIASECWGWSQASAPAQMPVAAYVTSAEFGGGMGRLTPVSYEAKGEEQVRVPAGRFRVRRVTRTLNKDVSDWWLHAELGIPVRGRTTGGMEYVLSSLKIPATSPAPQP